MNCPNACEGCVKWVYKKKLDFKFPRQTILEYLNVFLIIFFSFDESHIILCFSPLNKHVIVVMSVYLPRSQQSSARGWVDHKWLTWWKLKSRVMLQCIPSSWSRTLQCHNLSTIFFKLIMSQHEYSYWVINNVSTWVPILWN